MPGTETNPGVAGMERHTVIVDGARTRYPRSGRGGETIVCLHGFPQTGRSWERLAAELGEAVTVNSPDLRGANETQRPATGYDKRTLA